MEPIYIKVYTDRLEVRDLHTQEETSVDSKFSHTRMLIGDFFPAIKAIQAALQHIEVKTTSLFCKKRDVVIHPLEKIEDGLSKVEIRLFNEVVAAGFNRKYKKIVISAKLIPLIDAEIIELINKA